MDAHTQEEMASNRFVRSSKYRHIAGTAEKRDKCYDGIRITKSPHESNMCDVNSKFVAVVMEGQGGGPFFVAPLSRVRLERGFILFTHTVEPLYSRHVGTPCK